MAYAIKVGDSWQEITGAFTIGEGDDAIQYPPTWPDMAEPDERAAVGILQIIEPDPAPADIIVTGSDLVGDDVPQRIWQTQAYSLEQAQAIMWDRARQVQADHALNGCLTPAGAVQTSQDS